MLLRRAVSARREITPGCGQCPIPAGQGHEGSSNERQEKAGPSVARSHAGWAKGPGAPLLQDTPSRAEHKAGPVDRWGDSRRLTCPLQFFLRG